MYYDFNILAGIIFGLFVAGVLGLSKYFAGKSSSAEGYFAAGGTIHWAVNGIAFAGDFLSAASFLGICALIATNGYDGFLYSIGYLAGWIVALFVVAEPMKRLGKYTFTDALDSKFNSKGIQLMAAVSTLVVSVFYLIPQMVGAGVLVEPLLGLPQWAGVVGVGCIVTIIVATAGMTSTTYVQFLKGGLLIVCSTILVGMILYKGLTTTPEARDFRKFNSMNMKIAGETVVALNLDYRYVSKVVVAEKTFVKFEKAGVNTWWLVNGKNSLVECQSLTKTPAGKLYNGVPKATSKETQKLFTVGSLTKIVDVDGKEVESTGPLGPIDYLVTIQNSEFNSTKYVSFKDGEDSVKAYYPVVTAGADKAVPGDKFPVETTGQKLNFISLMLALFFGTAALPHILIRYYTVPSQRDARKSTIVAIACIGFFYVLTLFMGFGAATSGVIDVTDPNMAAPLLAKSYNTIIFSIICAIAFATVLGTVSGLIVAASGAVAHDLMDNYMGIEFTDKGKVMAGKIASIAIGVIAIALGIAFQGYNLAILVGLAFAVAASANLPAIIMLLFWKKTTAKGIAWSIGVGIAAALLVVKFEPWGIAQPGIISIPLAFLTIIVVSLLTQKDNENLPTEEEEATA